MHLHAFAMQVYAFACICYANRCKLSDRIWYDM